MKKKLVVILFGPPGSGKGTQAGLLSEKFNLYYLETSKILEEKFARVQGLPRSSKARFVSAGGRKYDILKEKKLWTSGILCSPPFVAKVVKEKLTELAKTGKNLVLAGSPRTLEEGKAVLPLLEKFYGKKNILVIFLRLKIAESIFRNSHRRICQLLRHPILYSKANEKLKFCPLDGSKLVRRKGLDDPATVRVRIKEFEKRTMPLLDYFKKKGLAVKIVKGEKSVADVFYDIQRILHFENDPH